MSNEEKIYDLMDWAAIEAIVYSEHDNPHELLGPHATPDGILIGAYVPEAQSITVVTEKEEYEMISEDDAGYFAALLPGKRIPAYHLRVVHRDGIVEEFEDPYAFASQFTEKDLERFTNGIHYEIYEKLGAHPMTIKGVPGTLFAVWAPNCIRVSVVGDFNRWDGRRHPMRRLGDSGIFELFVPGIGVNAIYKYELKAKGGLTYLKADPYANAAELRPANASMVADLNEFEWSDAAWLAQRKKNNFEQQPISIYEVHLGSFKKPQEVNGSFYNYREIAVMLAAYVKEMGYTHIELMPVMEHPFDGSWGYQVTGYYAVTSRYGTPEDFMFFMNYMHEQGIGVILDWVPAHFPRDTFGLASFDGTCLYEHLDPRQGSHPHWGTLIYNYGRPQVSNFLIANALFWVEKYHADGIRMDAVASMLYLDYGKQDGEWVANKYGGNENLEAIEMLHHLSSVFHKRKDGAVLIAEESTAWPEVTGDVEKGALGFDMKWNMGWMNDFTNYMKLDPLFRKGMHGALTFSMMYAYSEKFILVFSHDEVVHGKASMLYKMPGTMPEKFANLRLAYGFMMAHPGKKLLFMGQEFGQTREWSEERSLDWNLLDNEEHVQLQSYSAALNHFYTAHPALFEQDYKPEGFAWISCQDADHSLVSFVRNSKKSEEVLYVICNFTPVIYEGFKAAVPFMGKYKEIFNSDAAEFGGSGRVNARQKTAKLGDVDGQEQYIDITIPPFGFVVFRAEKDEQAEKAKKAKAKPVKKAAEKVEVKAEKAEKTEKPKRSRAAKKVEKPVEEVTAEPKPEVKAEKATEAEVKAEKAVKAEKTEKPKRARAAKKEEKPVEEAAEPKPEAEVKKAAEKTEKPKRTRAAKKVEKSVEEAAAEPKKAEVKAEEAAKAEVKEESKEEPKPEAEVKKATEKAEKAEKPEVKAAEPAEAVKAPAKKSSKKPSRAARKAANASKKK